MTKKKRFLATNGALTTIQTKSLRLTLVKSNLNLIFREATIGDLWSKTSVKSSSRQPKRNNQPSLRASSAREGVERGALSRATWPTNEQEFRKRKKNFRMIRRTYLISCFPIATWTTSRCFRWRTRQRVWVAWPSKESMPQSICPFATSVYLSEHYLLLQ